MRHICHSVPTPKSDENVFYSFNNKILFGRRQEAHKTGDEGNSKIQDTSIFGKNKKEDNQTNENKFKKNI